VPPLRAAHVGAEEAAEFYATVFPDSKVRNVTTLHDTPFGDADVVSFELFGHGPMTASDVLER